MLNFLCIGAQKSGTTWLYEALLRHPKVAFPGGKEVHFWNNLPDRDLQQYMNVFSNDDYINGDITPAYGFLPLSVIQKIYNLFPYLRLIYLIRDPRERAWSSAKMALGRSEMTIDEASDQWFIDHFMSKGSRARGDYKTCIHQWRSVFPSEQLLIVDYENIKSNPTLIMNNILHHVGLDCFYEKMDEELLMRKVFEGDRASIRASLVPVINDIYLDQIDSLGDYLQKDFSAWLQKHYEKK